MRVRREKSTTTKGHYVTNATLLAEVLRAKALNRVTNELAEMLLLMAQRYSRKSNFVGYSFRDDMISAALVNLCNNALKFNPEKSSNPFAFYTTAIHNSFLQYMADEKKHRNIRDALLVDAGSNPSFNFMEGERDESQLELPESDEIVPRNEREITPDTIVETKESVEFVGPVNVQLSPSRSDNIAHGKFRQDRTPGEVVRYSAKDVTLDENGNIVFIKAVEKPARKKRASSVKVEVAKVVKAKDPVKAVKKVVAKPAAASKKAVAKKKVEKSEKTSKVKGSSVAKATSKKPVAKKAAAKTTTAKKAPIKAADKKVAANSKAAVAEKKKPVKAVEATKTTRKTKKGV